MESLWISLASYIHRRLSPSKTSAPTVPSIFLRTGPLAIHGCTLGRGKLLNVQNRLLNELVGGLHTSGMFNAESGYPFWVNLARWATSVPTPLPSIAGMEMRFLRVLASTTFDPHRARQKLILGNWRSDPFNKTGSGGYINSAAFTTPDRRACLAALLHTGIRQTHPES